MHKHKKPRTRARNEFRSELIWKYLYVCSTLMPNNLRHHDPMSFPASRELKGRRLRCSRGSAHKQCAQGIILIDNWSRLCRRHHKRVNLEVSVDAVGALIAVGWGQVLQGPKIGE